MNYYAFLPLGAFIANMIVGFYILYKRTKDRLTILFSLFVFAVAIWALSDFFVMTSSTVEVAFLWNQMGTIGSATMSAFLLHFFLIFTKNKLLSKKKSHISVLLILYLPSLFFLFFNFTTKFITKDLIASDLGYISIVGPLYNLFTLYIVGYILAGLLICYNYAKKTKSLAEKKQAKIVIFAVSIPTAVGIITQVAPPFFGLQTIRLTTMTTTIMALLIAYAIFRYKLLAPASFSIGKKLVAGFLVISLLTGAVGYFSVAISQEELQKEIGEKSVILASQLVDKIDRDIYYRIEEFEYYCKLPVVREAIFESNQEFEKLENIQDYIDEKDNEWVSEPEESITPFMQGLMNNTLAIALIGRMKFYELRYDGELISEAFITNKYGANIIQTGKTSDYYQADEEWWQQANETRMYLSDVEYDESADVYSIDICLRIDDKEGDFLGIIKVVLNIEDMLKIIKVDDEEEEEEVYIRMVTKDGKLIYSTEEEFEFFSNVSDEFPSHIFFHQGGEKHETYFMQKCPGTGDEGLFAYAHSQGYRSYLGLGWIIIIEHESEEIFAPIIYLRNLLIAIAIAIVLIGLLFGIIISHILSKPIIKLNNAALKMSEGNLDVKIEINSNDEIGDLASSFSLMSKSLKEQQSNLENLVADRTKKLEKKVDELQRFKKVTVGREIKMVELKKKIKELEKEAKK